MISFHPEENPFEKRDAHFTAGFIGVGGMDMQRVACCISRFAWSPSIFKGGYRAKRNFTTANLMALDFDNGEMSLKEAINNVFCDMSCVIGTTKSHQVQKDDSPPCDRFRVVLRLEKALDDYEDYEHTIYNFARPYLGAIDTACLEAARYFKPCKEILFVSDDGFDVDVHYKPARIEPIYAPIPLKPEVTHELKKYITHVPHGERESSCYVFGRRLYDAGFGKEDAIRFAKENYRPDESKEPFKWQDLPRQISNGWEKQKEKRR